VDLINLKRKILDIQVDKLMNIGSFFNEYQHLLSYTQALAQMASTGTSKRPHTTSTFNIRSSRRNIPLVKMPNEIETYMERLSPSSNFGGPPHNSDSPPLKVELSATGLYNTN
jgi:hypothetical protein